jgi:hypothetical protein
MSTSALRTVCNHYGISVRNKGEYLNMTQMKQALEKKGIDATIFNKKSKISADLAIQYNDWRKRLNLQLMSRPIINEVLWLLIGKPDIASDTRLKKVGMDIIAEFSFVVTSVRFDTELRLYGYVDSFKDYGKDPNIRLHFPAGKKVIKLDFSYVHQQRYGVLREPRRINAPLKINQIIGQALSSSIINSKTPYAELNPSIYKSQPDPIWFDPDPLTPRGECFKNACKQELRGQSRSSTAKGIAKIHITYKQQYQTFALYNYITYLTQYPHLIKQTKVFLLSFDSRFHVDDSEIAPSLAADWYHYLNLFGYGARAQVVIYISDGTVDNKQLQTELDTFIDYWTQSGVDELIGRKSNNLIYNERLTRSIFYSISKSTDEQEDIRDTGSPKAALFSISVPLSKERQRFCSAKGRDVPTTRDKACINDKWGLPYNDLCGSSPDGKYPRSDLYFYHGDGKYSPDYYYYNDTCADRRRQKDRLSHLPDDVYDRH